ncbi:MAG TPA: IPTL-CTERM sorting domain-containing protein [Acidobacteriota bacterium]|nr:IPTL-CTERM sorting domain-containing protein [Acidobacteriota bacterium]
MKFAAGFLLVVGLFSAAMAQNTLWGDWFIVTEIDTNGQGTCTYSGEVHITQAASQIEGTVFQSLIGGSLFCPSVLAAHIMGTVSGSQVQGTLEGGALGTATFDATMDGNQFLGTFVPASAGPFPEISGSWVATENRTVDIPLLSPWGLALLGLLFALGALPFLRRKAS